MTGHLLAEAVGVDFDELVQLVDDLHAAGQTVGCAESLTGGLITAVLTSVPGASAVIRGGLVVYASDLKQTLADVDATLLAEVGAVHHRVARQLADGARRVCGADWGIGITGVAGPEQQDGRPVGTVLTCVVTGNSVLESADVFAGTRDQVRAAAVRNTFAMLRDMLSRPSSTLR